MGRCTSKGCARDNYGMIFFLIFYFGFFVGLRFGRVSPGDLGTKGEEDADFSFSSCPP